MRHRFAFGRGRRDGPKPLARGLALLAGLVLPALAVSHADEPLRLFEWTDEQGVVRYTPHLDQIPDGLLTTLVVMEQGEDGRAFAYIESVDGQPVLRSQPPGDGAVRKVVVMRPAPLEVEAELLALEAAPLEVEAELLEIEAELLEVESALLDVKSALLEAEAVLLEAEAAPLRAAEAAALDPKSSAAPPEPPAAPVERAPAPAVVRGPSEDRCSVARIAERTPWLSPLERLELLQAHRLYGTRVEVDGRVWQRLRLGFFPSLTAARSVQSRLEPSFPGAWITPVSQAERRASATTALAPTDEGALSAPGAASYAIQLGALPLRDCIPQDEQLTSRSGVGPTPVTRPPAL